MAMAAGEYVSVSTQADTEQAELARERGGNGKIRADSAKSALYVPKIPSSLPRRAEGAHPCPTRLRAPPCRAARFRISAQRSRLMLQEAILEIVGVPDVAAVGTPIVGPLPTRAHPSTSLARANARNPNGRYEAPPRGNDGGV